MVTYAINKKGKTSLRGRLWRDTVGDSVERASYGQLSYFLDGTPAAATVCIGCLPHDATILSIKGYLEALTVGSASFQAHAGTDALCDTTWIAAANIVTTGGNLANTAQSADDPIKVTIGVSSPITASDLFVTVNYKLVNY